MNGVLTVVIVCLGLQGVESVFDIMDMEDEDRNTLLRFSDAQMQVHVYTCTYAHIHYRIIIHGSLLE